MREINFRHALHGALALLAWWITGKLHGYKFIEVAGPVTARVVKED